MYVEITAKRAMFCNPLFKAERMSYPVPTPGAIIGTLQAVYWKPQMRYVIKRICVVNKPKFAIDLFHYNVSKFPSNEDNGQIRSENYLKDVRYCVEVEIELTGMDAKENNTVQKHEAILTSRLRKGQYFKTPYLGTRECVCDLSLADEMPESECKGEWPLGYMLHHVEHGDDGKARSVWYCPVMRDGMIDALERRKPDPLEEGDFLKNLINLYDMHGKELEMPELGFENAKITFEVVVSKDGILKEINPLQTTEKKKPYPKVMCVPKAGIKTINVVANFLWGNAEYLFLSDEKRKAFVKKMIDVCGTYQPEPVRSILAMYDKFDRERAEALLQTAGVQKENLVFRIEGSDGFVLDDPEVMECWRKWYSRERHGDKAFCVITGENSLVADKHPTVRGVYMAGSLARLLSMDLETASLSSYGYRGNENAPISQMASEKLHTALNYLLSRDEYKFDSDYGTTVFWARDSKVLMESLSAIVDHGKSFSTTIPEGEQFYMLELRGNGTGRIYVRQYERFEYGKDSKDRLEKFLVRAGCKTIRHDLLSQWEGRPAKSEKLERGYLLGRLFATMEQAEIDAQEESFDEVPSNFYKKYYRKTLSRPVASFARLHGLTRLHLAKVDYGLGKTYSEILRKLDKFIIPYPDSFSARDRMLFLAGYETQKKDLIAARWERIKKLKDAK